MKDLWYNLRLRIILKLKGKIVEGQKLTWWIRTVSWILFPLENLYLQNRHVQYDRLHDTFTLFGVRYQGDIFRNLKLPGNIFQVTEVKDGQVSVISLGNTFKGNRRARRMAQKRSKAKVLDKK